MNKYLSRLICLIVAAAMLALCSCAQTSYETSEMESEVSAPSSETDQISENATEYESHSVSAEDLHDQDDFNQEETSFVMPVFESAKEQGTCGDDAYWRLSSDGTLTISGTGEMNYYTYGDNNAPWVEWRNSIRHVIIEPGITCIGSDAFTTCYLLESITLTEGLTLIAEYAFSRCYSLESITFPDSLKEIGDHAFADCKNLKELVLTANIESIRGGMLAGCELLEHIEVSELNPYYDSREGCNAVISTSDDKLVLGCRNTVIPASVRSIGFHAFEGCCGLTELRIPDTVLDVDACFYNCPDLEYVSYPENIQNVKLYFSGCVNLREIAIPECVTQIGQDCFNGCGRLKHITIPDSVTDIGNCAFMDCVRLEEIRIGEHVRTISGMAFYRCTDLKEIFIPASVESIAVSNVFSSCNNLVRIEVAPDNPVYDSREGCNAIIESASNRLIYGCKETIIPDSVKSIANAAFHYITAMKSIHIPKGIEHIETMAFCGTGLETVTIPENVTHLENGAFLACFNLRSAAINASVETLGMFMFENCSSLEEVYICDGIEKIDNGCFAGCENLKIVHIPASVTTIEEGAFDKGSKDLKIYAGRGSCAEWFAQTHDIEYVDGVFGN